MKYANDIGPFHYAGAFLALYVVVAGWLSFCILRGIFWDLPRWAMREKT